MIFFERRRRMFAILAALCLAFAAMLVPSAAFAEEEASISYSLDGVHWSSTPPASIIPAGWIAVPGDSRTDTLHLRAERPGATLVALFAGTARSDDPAALNGLRVFDVAGAPVTIDGSTNCSALAPQTMLQRGETIKIPITVALDSGMLAGKNAALSLDILLVLSDTASVPLSNGCPVDPRLIPLFPGDARELTDETLPRSGSDIPMFALLAGLATVTGGLVAAIRDQRYEPRRRR